MPLGRGPESALHARARVGELADRGAGARPDGALLDDAVGRVLARGVSRVGGGPRAGIARPEVEQHGPRDDRHAGEPRLEPDVVLLQPAQHAVRRRQAERAAAGQQERVRAGDQRPGLERVGAERARRPAADVGGGDRAVGAQDDRAAGMPDRIGPVAHADALDVGDHVASFFVAALGCRRFLRGLRAGRLAAGLRTAVRGRFRRPRSTSGRTRGCRGSPLPVARASPCAPRARPRRAWRRAGCRPARRPSPAASPGRAGRRSRSPERGRAAARGGGPSPSARRGRPSTPPAARVRRVRRCGRPGAAAPPDRTGSSARTPRRRRQGSRAPRAGVGPPVAPRSRTIRTAGARAPRPSPSPRGTGRRTTHRSAPRRPPACRTAPAAARPSRGSPWSPCCVPPPRPDGPASPHPARRRCHDPSRAPTGPRAPRRRSSRATDGPSARSGSRRPDRSTARARRTCRG